MKFNRVSLKLLFICLSFTLLIASILNLMDSHNSVGTTVTIRVPKRIETMAKGAKAA